ncbi:BBE domain-containing protein [Kitasatospora sp. NPDC001603]|uniref:BBE domain-containing protein n=1 Tax=Kitasatospora sp. NPDC001603 TaxID=3154388 RepID=UPI00331C1A89
MLTPDDGSRPWAARRRRPRDNEQNYARLLKAGKTWDEKNVFHRAQSVTLPS